MADIRGAGPEAAREPVEIEWQFDALDLRPVERWLASVPALAVKAGGGGTITALAKTPRRLVDTYLDTDDWRMGRAGFVLRTRRRGRHDEVTLKDTRPADEGGLRRRLEVTEQLPPGGVGALDGTGPVGYRVHAIAGTRRLREVLKVRTRRRPFALRVGGVDAAEVALDDTMIVVGAGQRPMQLRRVEVEVRPEWVDALEPVVERLRASCGLQPATLSKFEAGLLAVGQVIPGPPDLGPTGVTASSTMGELAYAVIRRQLAVLAAKEAGTRLGEDPEELHDMRVATRRLRAALDLFAEVLPARAQGYREELRWLGSVLGAVRDLDVQREGMDDLSDTLAGWSATALHVDGHHPLADLSALLERERDRARTELLAALDSIRWERLYAGLSSMARQGPLRRALATRVPAAIGVPDLVVARHDKVARAARRARRSGVVSDFHRLRISCKRLRYSLEFSADVYDGRTARYVRRLTALQDELGLLQDAEVASTRLAELATGEAHLPPATIFVMGALAERDRLSERRLLARLPRQTKRVRGRAWDELLDLMEERRAESVAAQPPARRTLRAVPAPAPAAPDAHPALPVPPPGPLPVPAAPNLTALGPLEPSPPPAPSSGQGE
jgi:CHAD domain-containing protein